MSKETPSKKVFLEIEKALNRYYQVRNLCNNNNYITNNPQLEFILNNMSGFLGIIDIPNNCYIYASDSCQSMFGLEPSSLVIEGQGIKNALSVFYPEHAKQFSEVILPTFLEFCKENKVDGGVKQMKLSFKNKLLVPEGKYSWFFHQITILDTDENGMPNLALKFIKGIDGFKDDNNLSLTISKKNSSGIYEIIHEKMIQIDSKSSLSISAREREIIQLLSQGLSSKSIADELFISIHTVNTHKKNMLKKLNLSSSSQLVRFGMANGIIL